MFILFSMFSFSAYSLSIDDIASVPYFDLLLVVLKGIADYHPILDLNSKVGKTSPNILYGGL